MQGLAGTKTIVDISRSWRRRPQYGHLHEDITPPSARLALSGKVYHRCTIVNVEDGDTVQMAHFRSLRPFTIAYTLTTAL